MVESIKICGTVENIFMTRKTGGHVSDSVMLSGSTSADFHLKSSVRELLTNHSLITRVCTLCDGHVNIEENECK